jgi:hypothetical protein
MIIAKVSYFMKKPGTRNQEHHIQGRCRAFEIEPVVLKNIPFIVLII